MNTEVSKPKDGKLVPLDEFAAVEDALGMKIHPTARRFPRLTGPAYDALVADVKAKGVYVPIVVQGGFLLDGITRVTATIDAGRKVDAIPTFTLGNDKSAVEFIASANLHRRHLTDKQRVEAAAYLTDDFKAEAAERQKAGKSLPPDGGKVEKRQDRTSVAKAAAVMGVKPRSVERKRKALGLSKPRKPSPKPAQTVNPEKGFEKLYARVEVVFGSVGPAVRRRLVEKLSKDYPAAFRE